MGRRKLESISDYARALKNGFGRGSGEGYVPWIRAQDISSHGRSTKLPGITVHREHHLLSDHEKRLFLCAEYQPSVIDIREQFPLFPVELAERIAEQAGIPYPKNRKSKDLRVLTTDFLLTISTENGPYYLAIAVKPSAELRKVYVRQILDIERLWWSLLGVKWLFITEKQQDRQVADNLDWISDVKRGTKMEETEEQIPKNSREMLLEILLPGSYIWEELITSAANLLDVEEKFAARLIRAMAWERLIEVDLTVPIQREGLIRIERNNVELHKEMLYGTHS